MYPLKSVLKMYTQKYGWQNSQCHEMLVCSYVFAYFEYSGQKEATTNGSRRC